jgi:hypothetical protein|tara:strand:+ start:2475 stop:2651 length:177 start_codon:yes stop_codon:yes gene_type:complete
MVGYKVGLLVLAERFGKMRAPPELLMLFGVDALLDDTWKATGPFDKARVFGSFSSNSA